MLKKLRFSIAILLALFMMLSLYSSTVLAAEVGQKLVPPESGWQRIDDRNSAFVYSSGWVQTSSLAGFFNSNNTASNITNSTLTFKFKGTKLRLIDQLYNNRGNAEIEIDGVKDVYNAYSAVDTTSQVLVYEKSGLVDGIHNVKIKVLGTVPSGSRGSYVSIDAIDIDGAGYLIDSNIAAPTNLYAMAGNNKVDLKWTGATDATSYVVKRSLTSGGPYNEIIATNVKDAVYTDENAKNGVTYYYVVTAIDADSESANSNEASATPQAPVNNGRAILIVTLDTGIEKEFDLSMDEVNAFIFWYEGKAAGSGTASYAIDKHDNNKGPFKNRKDYVIFDKILTFEVNEYEVTD